MVRITWGREKEAEEDGMFGVIHKFRKRLKEIDGNRRDIEGGKEE